MRKLILQMQMTADGFVAAANPDLDWQVWDWGEPWTWDRKLQEDFNAIFASIDCILLSRPMAEEGYLEHWGTVAKRFPADPLRAFARRIVEAQKVVFSKRPAQPSRWERTTVARRKLADEVALLKRRPGGTLIAFGGTGFASALIAARVVDEFQFFINPTIAGDGDSIFTGEDGGLRLKLLASTAYACGIIVSRYAPAQNQPGPRRTRRRPGA